MLEFPPPRYIVSITVQGFHKKGDSSLEHYSRTRMGEKSPYQGATTKRYQPVGEYSVVSHVRSEITSTYNFPGG